MATNMAASGRVTAAGSGCTCPLLEALGLAQLEHNPKNNRVRAIQAKSASFRRLPSPDLFSG